MRFYVLANIKLGITEKIMSYTADDPYILLENAKSHSGNHVTHTRYLGSRSKSI